MTSVTLTRGIEIPISEGTLIHGMPTTGKTWLRDALLGTGVLATDTDDLMKRAAPDYYGKKLWRKGVPIRDAHPRMGHDVVNLLEAGFLVITNVWPSQMTTDPEVVAILTAACAISFYRDAASMTRISEERGGAVLPYELTSDWVDGYLQGWSASPRIRLKEEEFIATNALLSRRS